MKEIVELKVSSAYVQGIIEEDKKLLFHNKKLETRIMELENKLNLNEKVNSLMLLRLENKEIRIKELEERIELAEATRDDGLAYAKGYKVRAEELGKELYKLMEKKIER